ncbi:hypothetical protein Bca4012_037513 [Brassica carinata]
MPSWIIENNLTVNNDTGVDFTRKEVDVMFEAGSKAVGLRPHRFCKLRPQPLLF